MKPSAHTLKAIAIDRRRTELLNVNRIIQVSTVHSAQISARRVERQIIPVDPRSPTRPYNICTHGAYNGLKGLPATRAIVSAIVMNTHTHAHTSRKPKGIGKCYSKRGWRFERLAKVRQWNVNSRRNEEGRWFKVNEIYLPRLYIRCSFYPATGRLTIPTLVYVYALFFPRASTVKSR